MGPLTPIALVGYKHITKISDEYTKWTEPYWLKSKHDAFSSFYVFVQSVVIPNGFRVERLRVEYASTNTSQQVGMSERVGRTLAAMVRCMLADSGLSKFMWG